MVMKTRICKHCSASFVPIKNEEYCEYCFLDSLLMEEGDEENED